MAKIVDELTAECTKCHAVYHGETSQLKAENCEAEHERYFFEVWDYELPRFVSYFNLAGDPHDLLPQGFRKALKQLTKRALGSKVC